ncbi:S8 family serine peptidase, partial [Streptomyces sp. NPDC050164]|uniref:S8 family serine peptidase n=1 Tax=Streptomyces sp. NPDC050164 TaxID=3365605 RepID=UPI00379A59D8
MKRRIWTTVVTTVMTVTLGVIPAHAVTSPSTAAANTAEDDLAGSATQDDPIDPPLYDETADGDTVRVNVVTENRDDLSSVASTGETVQSFSTLPVVTLRVDRTGLDELAAQDGVISVSEDVPVPPTLDESVPLIGGDNAIKAGRTGKGSAIAVIDTGVATNHPFLKDRVVSEACFSTIDAAYSATSLCPNGTAKQEGTGAANSAGGPCATLEGCDHGTHVAGIAAGNGAGVPGAPATGVAPDADIIAIQVFSKFDSTKYCGTAAATPCVRSFTSAQIAALEKVWQLQQAGTPVIAANLSLGSASYTTACTKDARKPAIDKLLDAGVATVAASGNNGLETAVNAPACVPSAIAVGSTTDDDEVSSFSNRGPLLDLFAPGNGIISSVLNGYDSKSGTSMAAPHVTGALASLKQAYPDKSVTDLESLLKTAGTTITEAGVSTPRIDIGKALGEAEPEPEPATRPLPSKIINDADHIVPDAGSVQSPITVNGFSGNAPGALQVSVNLTHEWLGEVKIDLVDPDGKTYALKTANGTDPGGTLSKTYTVAAGASPANGTWTLQLQDTSAGAEGTLDNWSLTFPSHENQTDHAIPDAGSVESPITVSGLTGSAPKTLQVYVDATHEWLGDVEIGLVAPDGKTYPLKSTS